MKKDKKYKLVKGIIATALSGVMVTSFAGCGVKNAVYKDQENPISLYDESGNPLSVIALVDKDNVCKGDELYGYIQKDGEKIKFYDVEYDKTYTLYEGHLSDYSVFYAPFTSLLIKKDFNRALGYGSVDKSVINLMQDNLMVKLQSDGYVVDNKTYIESGINRAELHELNPETYFVDDEQNNKEQETTLAKNK